MHPLFEKQEIHKRCCFGRLLCALRAADKNPRNLRLQIPTKYFPMRLLQSRMILFEAISAKLHIKTPLSLTLTEKYDII